MSILIVMLLNSVAGVHAFLFAFPTAGSYPGAGLVQGADASFYGTTSGGGGSNLGTVFEITSNGTISTLHSFTGTGSDGSNPYAGLVQGTDGSFYGTTSAGGSSNLGTVFKITSNGTVSTLHSFTGTGSDGSSPQAGLVQGTDGSFYGTTSAGGSSNLGTVFRITSSGTISTLHSFTGTGSDGSNPYAGLLQGTDGSFYGTTYAGGSSNLGTVFEITSNGTISTLHSFTGTGSDGSYPYAGLVQGTDASFYGTTSGGGSSSNLGTVFKITSNGTISTLHSFTGTGSDGSSPTADLVQGTDGIFYGTTSGGGISNHGTVFKITSNGTISTLHSFTGTGSDGSSPTAGLVQGTDGIFYGTTSGGGSSNDGTVFKITSNGTISTLSSFVNADGSTSLAALVPGPDGSLYGTAYAGGNNNAGTVFKISSDGAITTLHSFAGTGSDGFVT